MELVQRGRPFATIADASQNPPPAGGEDSRRQHPLRGGRIPTADECRGRTGQAPERTGGSARNRVTGVGGRQASGSATLRRLAGSAAVPTQD